MSAHRNILSFLWFQAGWWGVLLLASRGENLASGLFALLMVGLHFLGISENKQQDLKRLVACSGLGIVGDFLLLQTPLFSLTRNSEIFPIWLASLWVLLPLSFNYSFRPLLERRFLFPLIGFLTAFSYFEAGRVFALLTFQEPLWLGFLVVSSVWIFYLFCFSYFFKKTNKS